MLGTIQSSMGCFSFATICSYFLYNKVDRLTSIRKQSQELIRLSIKNKSPLNSTRRVIIAFRTKLQIEYYHLSSRIQLHLLICNGFFFGCQLSSAH
jgi:hypothetical protein